MSESWQVESRSNDYDPDEFYVGASNNKGFSSSYRIRMPPLVANQLAVIVASQQIPWYQTVQDIFRDALIHRLHHVGELYSDPKIKQIAAEHQHHAEAEMLARKVQESQKALSNVEAALAGARSAEQKHEALLVCRKLAETTTDSAFRDQYTRLLSFYGGTL